MVKSVIGFIDGGVFTVFVEKDNVVDAAISES
jgi:hypothetical protein